MLYGDARPSVGSYSASAMAAAIQAANADAAASMAVGASLRSPASLLKAGSRLSMSVTQANTASNAGAGSLVSPGMGGMGGFAPSVPVTVPGGGAATGSGDRPPLTARKSFAAVLPSPGQFGAPGVPR